MKRLVTLLIILTFSTSHGQFLKKLGNKALKSAERTIQRKVEHEASKKTNKMMDDIFKKEDTDSNDSANSDEFTYHFKSYYTMQIVQKKDTLLSTIYWGDDDHILGSRITLDTDQKVFSIIDLNQNLIHNLMDFGNQKTRTSMRFSPNEISQFTAQGEIKIEPLDKLKEILGYTCTGYSVQGDDYSGIVWVTEDSDIGHPEGLANLQKDKTQQSGINLQWMNHFDGLALEVDMTITNKRKPQRVLMRCVELGTIALQINTAYYKNTF
ncbi:DUF4412 domain-containing protein [Croceiramulus getboli]|nr:DUF4412 domain-containing protein [Flavobacteriaceae bacterium YJPT1-3]